jgi:hypothetical protein
MSLQSCAQSVGSVHEDRNRPRATDVNDYADALRRELSAAIEQAQPATQDHDAALAAADRFTDLIRTLDSIRREASDEAKKLIGSAIRAGVDPHDFYGRPFTGTVVRSVASQAGYVFPHRGRRPSSRTTE